MADKYERYLMKQKLKEAKHQARLEDERRKRELEEIKAMKSERRSQSVQSFLHLIAMIPIGLILLAFAFLMLDLFVFNGQLEKTMQSILQSLTGK